jgi:hypothetical protein
VIKLVLEYCTLSYWLTPPLPIQRLSNRGVIDVLNWQNAMLWRLAEFPYCPYDFTCCGIYWVRDSRMPGEIYTLTFLSIIFSL